MKTADELLTEAERLLKALLPSSLPQPWASDISRLLCDIQDTRKAASSLVCTGPGRPRCAEAAASKSDQAGSGLRRIDSPSGQWFEAADGE